MIVVEDDSASRELLRRLLSPHFEVVLAPSGNVLRKIVRGLEPGRTVVLMDLDLGSGAESGIDLAGDLRADRRWGDTPILAVSAHVDPYVRSLAFRVGCDGFHEKPIRPRLLVTEIRELLVAKGTERNEAVPVSAERSQPGGVPCK